MQLINGFLHDEQIQQAAQGLGVGFPAGKRKRPGIPGQKGGAQGLRQGVGPPRLSGGAEGGMGRVMKGA
jgi:hypothetical protein